MTARAANQVEHADGRVELIDVSRVERSPLYNEDLAPVPIRTSWTTYNYARALDQHGALHPDLHAVGGL